MTRFSALQYAVLFVCWRSADVCADGCAAFKGGLCDETVVTLHFVSHPC